MSETVNEPEPLTPNHLLQGSHIEPIPTCVRMDQIKDQDYLLQSENNLRGKDKVQPNQQITKTVECNLA